MSALDAHRNSKAAFRCPSHFEMGCTWLQTRSKLCCGYTQTRFCSKKMAYKARLAKEQKKWPRVVEKCARGHTKPVPGQRTASRSAAPTLALHNQTTSKGFPKTRPNHTTDRAALVPPSVCSKQKSDESKIHPFPSVLPKTFCLGDRPGKPSPVDRGGLKRAMLQPLPPTTHLMSLCPWTPSAPTSQLLPTFPSPSGQSRLPACKGSSWSLCASRRGCQGR